MATPSPYSLYLMKILMISGMFCLIAVSAFAQNPLPKLLNVNLGYGTENNFGNTGFTIGVGGQKFLTKKFDLQADLNYFTTGIYNSYHKEEKFPGEERFYHNAIVSLKAGYAVVGIATTFNIRLKAGVSTFLYNYKILKYAAYIVRSDGTVEVIPNSILYYREKGLRLGYTFGLEFNIPINPNTSIAAGVDTYSSEIPIEFFIPGISFKRRL
jgi:hypothetical protein